MEVSPAFLKLLREFDVDHLEAHPAAVYGVWPDFTLAFANAAWDKFYVENGGRNRKRIALGANIMDVVPQVLQKFYRGHYTAVLQEGRPWEHIYECSSPGEIRQFHMLTYPLPGKQGLLILNSLRYEAPRDAPTNLAHASYADEDGIVLQCSHCRRVRAPGASETWDWAPSLVRTPHPEVSHGLCRPCFAFYYGEHGQKGSLPQSVSTIDPPSLEAKRVLKQLWLQTLADGELPTKPILTSPEEAFYSANSPGRLH